MRRLLNRLRQVQSEALLQTSEGGPLIEQFNDAMLIALATVLHEGGIVAAPTGDDKRRFVATYAPRGKTEVPRK
jgi:hypothetical protein